MSVFAAWIWLMAWVITTTLWVRICNRRIAYGNEGQLRRDGLSLVFPILTTTINVSGRLLAWKREIVPEWLGFVLIGIAFMVVLHSSMWHLALFFIKAKPKEPILTNAIDHYFE